MLRTLILAATTSTAVAVSFGSGYAGTVRDDLPHRLTPSRIDVADASAPGRLATKGAVLILLADQVPAKPMRTVQVNTKSPRFHVADYARVEVSRDDRLVAPSAAIALPKGTRLVVLDLRVRGDQVHVFTHTLEPVPLSDGKAAHGCTEFVFDFDRETLGRADARAVTARIDQWFATSPAT